MGCLQMSDLKKLKGLIRGTNINSPLNFEEDTALHYAVYIGDTQVLTFLLGLRPDLTQKNKVGGTIDP